MIAYKTARLNGIMFYSAYKYAYKLFLKIVEILYGLMFKGVNRVV